MKKLLMCVFLSIMMTGCVQENQTSSNLSSSSVKLTTKIDKEDIAKAYNNVANYMNELTKNNIEPTIMNFNKKYKYIESDNFSTLQSTVAIIKFVSNLYSSEEFICSDEFVSFKITINDDLLNMCLLNETNTLENKINCSLFLHDGDPINGQAAIFMHFDIDYNFETEVINGFEIRQIDWVTDDINLHFKYENGVYYELEMIPSVELDQIATQTISIRNKYKEKINSYITIDHDFGDEYASAMLYAFGE